MQKVQRVLLVHNSYLHRGGEDTVFEAERELLETSGIAVRTYVRSNADIQALRHIDAAAQALWSRRTVAEVGEMISGFHPDVVHVHNSFPLISPALFWAAQRAGVATVASLHNFRLLCPQAMLLRDGMVCERCVGHLPWQAIRFRCYRGATGQSAVAAAVLQLHRWLGTWHSKVDRYIALTEFARDKFVAGGLPPNKLVVKPNFVDLPATPPERSRRGLLFVGRLSEEKGLRVLADAATLAPLREPVQVVGEGPMEFLLQGMAGMTLAGALTMTEVVARMRDASALIVPSIWIENFPRTLVEAMACGLPVIASRLGAMATLVEEGRTGLLFAPGDARDLRRQMDWALAHPERLAEMGLEARRRYEAKFTGQVNLRQLLSIYAEACEVRKSSSGR